MDLDSNNQQEQYGGGAGGNRDDQGPACIALRDAMIDSHQDMAGIALRPVSGLADSEASRLHTEKAPSHAEETRTEAMSDPGTDQLGIRGSVRVAQ